MGNNLGALGLGVIVTGAAIAVGVVTAPVSGPVGGVVAGGIATAVDYYALNSTMKDLQVEKNKVNYSYLKCLRQCSNDFPGKEDEIHDFLEIYPTK